MATLSGQTIQSTYQGLLKFSDSTTGITSSFQSIEDGLGNATGMRIKPNEFDVPNLMYFRPMKGAYYGIGVSSNSGVNPANQNIIVANPFIDNGLYSYSAITLFTALATSTNDTIEFGLYSPQETTQGLMPGSAIVTGITASTTSTGLQTYTFATPISFSGSPGLNFLVSKISNSGVTPTVRFGLGVTLWSVNNIVHFDYGFINNFDGLSALYPFRSVTGSPTMSYSGITNFENTFNPIDLVSFQSSTLSSPSYGFVLHTI